MSVVMEAVSVAGRTDLAGPAAVGVREQPVSGRAVAELFDVCIVNLDCSLRVLEANGDFLNQLGRSAADVYGQSFGDFIHPSVRQVVLHQLTRLSEGRRERFSANVPSLRANSGAFYAEVTAVAVRGDNGRVSTIVLMMRPDRNSEPPRGTTDKRKALGELDARVLEGVAAGISTVQLASKLFLSRQGIEYHVGAMLRRFKCPNRSALVAKAYSQGILCIGQWPPKVAPDYIR